MDILTKLAHDYWNWVGNFHPIFQMFLLRWACLLLSLLFFGTIVRTISIKLVSRTLALQVLAVALGIIVGFSISVEKALNLKSNDLNLLLTISILTWLIVPYFLPQVLIRRRGFQRITWPVIYLTEFVLLVVQFVALKGN